MDGLLLIDKPTGWTSNDIVQKMRGVLGIRKIGHAGTLDPDAEGLLILLVGRATKQQGVLQGHDKDYVARIRLGRQTATADAEGEVVAEQAIPDFDQAQLEAIAKKLEGEQEQVPPAYSAVKVNGKPAYYWARKNKAVTLKARTISVDAFTIQEFGSDWVRFGLSCSSGTYVRTLAEDFAQALGTVGHIDYLRRTRIGQWSVDQATAMVWIKEAPRDEALACIIPLPESLEQTHAG